GVKGIGPKTAVSLLSQYKTLDALYEKLDEVKGATRQKLSDGQKSAFSSKSLATIRCDIPLDFDFEHCRLTMPDVSVVADYLTKPKFTSILRRLPQTLAPFNNGVPPVIDVAIFKAAAGGAFPGRGQGQVATAPELETLVDQNGKTAVAQLSILPER